MSAERPSSEHVGSAPGDADTLDQFYREVAAYSLQPLWTQKKNLMPNEPAPATAAWLWKWQELQRLARRAGDLVSIDRGGDRRVLSLANPGLAGLPFATSTLWGAVQYLGPRESAPAHRHTPGAIRFVLEGEGVWTTVDGDACDMAPGDLILTPKWRWHEHCNGGDQPMIWFDGLDMPLTIALDAVFYENYPELTQEVKGRNISERIHASRGLDTSVGITGLETCTTSSDLSSPRLVYRRAETDARLKALIGSRQAPMATVPFLNPMNGRATLPTMGCEMHRITAGKRTPTERRVGSSVWVVFSGRGATVINGQRFDWSRGDIFVVPSWAEVDHLAEESSDLFSINDRPVLEALGLFREEISAEPQRVREVFQPSTTAASTVR